MYSPYISDYCSRLRDASEHFMVDVVQSFVRVNCCRLLAVYSISYRGLWPSDFKLYDIWKPDVLITKPDNHYWTSASVYIVKSDDQI